MRWYGLWIAVGLLLASGIPHMGYPQATGETNLYTELLYLDLDPDTSEFPLNGLLSQLDGPYPLPPSFNIKSISALDIGGTSVRKELLFLLGNGDGPFFWIDYDAENDDEKSGLFLLRPPVTLDAFIGFDMGGSPQLDIVGCAGSDLYILDLNVPFPRWDGPISLPFTVLGLATANVVGSKRLDLVATDGVDIWALDTAEPLESLSNWVLLARPPSPPEIIAKVDIGIGVATQLPKFALQRLTVYSGLERYFYTSGPNGGSWSGPLMSRFRLRAASPFDLNYPWSPPQGSIFLPEPTPSTTMHFEDVAKSSELDSPFHPGGSIYGPGAVFTDLDADNSPDLYLVRGDGGAGPNNLLYMGDGSGGFIEVVNAGDAIDSRNGAGAIAADFDNDGDRDLYVVNFNDRNTLLENRDGTFVDITESTDPTPEDPEKDQQEGVGTGISFSGCEPGEPLPCLLNDSLAAAAADFNRDGYLDIYVGNHLCCVFPEGERDILYLNNGDGTFTDITLAAGISEEAPVRGHRSTEAVVIADLNGDLWPDIYVANKKDGPPRDQLFLNDGDTDGNGWDGTFTEWYSTQPWYLGNVTEAAMGIDVADYDNDGDLDLFLTDLGEMDLLRNRLTEDGSFSIEIVSPNPVASPNFSWGTSWADFDNDGDVELHVSTGPGVMNWLHQNEGDGNFTDVALAAGVGQAKDSRASVPADYDRDGRVDLLVVQRNPTSPISLFRNQTETESHWLQIQLEGAPQLPPAPYRSTRDAIGARIDLIPAEGQTQRRDIKAGGHICASTGDYTATFGLGDTTVVSEIKVRWPSGRISQRLNVPADQLLVIREEDDE